MPNGRQVGCENLRKFNDWVTERDLKNDWDYYARGNKLIRGRIADKCVFADSVLYQNPAVRAALKTLEVRLREVKPPILSHSPKAKQSPIEEGKTANLPSEQAVDRRAAIDKIRLDQRIKTLEEENAAFRAELGDAKEALRRYKYMESHLAETGRLIRP